MSSRQFDPPCTIRMETTGHGQCHCKVHAALACVCVQYAAWARVAPKLYMQTQSLETVPPAEFLRIVLGSVPMAVRLQQRGLTRRTATGKLTMRPRTYQSCSCPFKWRPKAKPADMSMTRAGQIPIALCTVSTSFDSSSTTGSLLNQSGVWML